MTTPTDGEDEHTELRGEQAEADASFEDAQATERKGILRYATATLVIATSLALAAVTGAAVSEREDTSLRDAVTPSRSETCPSARRAVRYYQRRANEWRAKMGAGSSAPMIESPAGTPCPLVRRKAERWRAKAHAARLRYERWHEYHYAWWKWLPDKWQRIGACETGYGRRPGNWKWNSGTYQGAFGFYHGSWDAFIHYADPKAGPYPSEAYLATPRQQYEVALAIWRR